MAMAFSAALSRAGKAVGLLQCFVAPAPVTGSPQLGRALLSSSTTLALEPVDTPPPIASRGPTHAWCRTHFLLRYRACYGLHERACLASLKKRERERRRRPGERTAMP
ncbi:hypothetical protein GOP47_0020359, partial [Adiantum capillus-veneris]